MSQMNLKLALVCFAISMPVSVNLQKCTSGWTIEGLAEEFNRTSLSEIFVLFGYQGSVLFENAKDIVNATLDHPDSVKPVLELVKELAYAGLDVDIYEVLIQEMISRNILNGNDSVSVAMAMHHTMQKPSFATLSDETKQTFALLKEKLPESVRGIVAPRLRIKGISGEYLMTDIVDRSDWKRRNVFVAESEKWADEFLWTIGTPA
jgi:hypothetical protein